MFLSAFSDVIAVSMYEENQADVFEKYLRAGKTAAFIGSSGVGKSTLINSLLGNEVQRTKEIGKEDKGRHTTTGKEMFPSSFFGGLQVFNFHYFENRCDKAERIFR